MRRAEAQGHGHVVGVVTPRLSPAVAMRVQETAGKTEQGEHQASASARAAHSGHLRAYGTHPGRVRAAAPPQGRVSCARCALERARRRRVRRIGAQGGASGVLLKPLSLHDEGVRRAAASPRVCRRDAARALAPIACACARPRAERPVPSANAPGGRGFGRDLKPLPLPQVVGMVVTDKRLRKRVFSACFDEGLSAREIQAGIMPSYNIRTVQRLLREFRQTFSWEPMKNCRACKRVSVLGSTGLKALDRMLREDPSLFLVQMKRILRVDYGIDVSRSTICRAIHTPVKKGGLGLSLKTLEKRAMQQNIQERTRWLKRLELGDFKHENVLVLDESNVGENMMRRRKGYGPSGQRVRWWDYFGKKRNGTMLAACNQDGFVLSACTYIQETMDTDRFIQYIKDDVVPVLGSYALGERNSVVVMDNVAQHHHDEIRRLIDDAGALLLFVPRYSPDLSPIELGFSAFKRAVADVNPEARKCQVTVQYALYRCLAAWPQEHARKCFRHCGFSGVKTLEEEREAARRRRKLVMMAMVVVLDSLRHE